MKILVILSRVPFPLEKGDKLRAYHQLKELNKRHEITLCCITDIEPLEGSDAALAEISDNFHIFKLQKWRIYLNLMLGFFSRKPFQVLYFYQKRIHRSIAKITAETAPDIIYCQLIRTAEYAKNEHDYRKVLDYQDTFSKGIERRLKKARWPMTNILTTERRRLISYENIIFEYFEGKTIISEEDRRYLYHPERKDIAVVTNGVDTDFFQKDTMVQPTFDLLFTGNMSYPPNIETAEYIAHELLPKLKETRPGISLLLAGSDPHRRVRALAKIPGVEVSGWVDDIRTAYSDARIFCAPMQIGTGLQNKLLEAMSMELPCVTSELANKPLKANDKQELLEGKDTEEYVALINQLLEDESMRRALGSCGRAFVKSRFSWVASVHILESLMLGKSAGLGD